MTRAEHLPVLLEPCLELLRPRPGSRFIDCTVDGGGHSLAILERTAPDGTLLALDADPAAVQHAAHRLLPHGARVRVVHANFRQLAQVAAAAGFHEADGILMDLGLSSLQLSAPERGFAFASDGPLDMRYDPSAGSTAAEFLAAASAEVLERAFRELGQESQARRIALAVVAARARAPFQTTGQLVAVVTQAIGGRRGRLHPATRVFQALRILVNDELNALREAIPQAVGLLKGGARLAVISFHSLEDQIVKTLFARLAGRRVDDAGTARIPVMPPPLPMELRVVTPKPVRPSAEEQAANPRCRSARLRVAERA